MRKGFTVVIVLAIASLAFSFASSGAMFTWASFPSAAFTCFSFGPDDGTGSGFGP